MTTGISAETFNTDQKFIQSFCSTVANTLHEPTTAISNIVATDPAAAIQEYMKAFHRIDQDGSGSLSPEGN